MIRFVTLSAVVAFVAASCVPAKWLKPVDILHLRLAILLWAPLCAGYLASGVYLYYTMTLEQRMYRSIFTLASCVFAALIGSTCAGVRFLHFDGDVLAEINNGTNPQKPLIIFKLTGGANRVGVDPFWQVVILLVLWFGVLFYSSHRLGKCASLQR